MALISAAVLIGLLSPRVELSEVMGEVMARFGGVVGRIGIAIAMAAVIGQCLMESGAADKITRRFVAWLGAGRNMERHFSHSASSVSR